MDAVAAATLTPDARAIASETEASLMLATIRDVLLIVLLAPFAAYIALLGAVWLHHRLGRLWRWIVNGWGLR
jgi:hypothetical protein